MASEAYLKAISEIPKDIRDDVIGSINIANEIQMALTKLNKSPADLARMMGKSESEISKWLTGLHNFTFKTVRRIENVLDTKLVMTSSEKLECYDEIIKANISKIRHLEGEINRLKGITTGNISWTKAVFGYKGMNTHILISGLNKGMNAFVIQGGHHDDIQLKTPREPQRYSFSRIHENET